MPMLAARVRDETVDVAKGFLIFLVVLGHVMLLDENYLSHPVFKFCYSFHMFLFMYIGGGLIARRENNWLWLEHRFLRLMVPFFVWGFLRIFISGNFDLALLYHIPALIWRMLVHPPYWYLLVLFISDILLVLSSIILKHMCKSAGKKLTLCVGFAVCGVLHVAYLFASEWYTLKMIAIYYPFYFAGWFASKYKVELKQDWCKKFAILYPLSMAFYGYKDRIEQAEILKQCMILTSVPTVCANGIYKFFLGVGGVLYNHYVVAPLGCFFAWSLIKELSRMQKTRMLLGHIGYYSLSIYILHEAFVHHYLNIVYIDECISLCLGIWIPIQINKWTQHSCFFNRILFGI